MQVDYEAARKRKKKAKAKGLRIGTRKAVKKLRFVDGHEAVILNSAGIREQRLRLRDRCNDFCECGCGRGLTVHGMDRHHWKGRTRGNRCDCDFHIQALTRECHREAEKHRKGAPFKRGYDTTVTRHSEHIL